MVFTRDGKGGPEIRAKYRQAHLDYLATWETKLIASGGVQDETGAFIGGMIIIDVDTKAEAEAFVHNDPFRTAGLFGEVNVFRWFQTYLHGRADRTPFKALPRE